MSKEVIVIVAVSKHQTFKNQEEANRWFKSSLVRSYGHVREWTFQTKVTCETDTDNFVKSLVDQDQI
ncbi:hypothetical protein BDB01DRAFT_855623 [Pilobolus umbonatus]|nr:hypothetical protein BDB01DRAFT_855623 [Pilobolus umbonatus]